MTNIERNEAIWREHQSGKPVRQIARDYGISAARVQSIITRYRGHLAASTEPYIIRKAKRDMMALTARTSTVRRVIESMERDLLELRQLLEVITGTSFDSDEDLSSSGQGDGQTKL